MHCDYPTAWREDWGVVIDKACEYTIKLKVQFAKYG
jgi:hypothetical protein